MTLRQTAIMVTGILCAELAHLVYSAEESENETCKATSTNMPGAFRNKLERKDEDKINTLQAHYGKDLNLSGRVFGNAGRNGQNFGALGELAWLQVNDAHVPEHVKTSIHMIGNVKDEVKRIMRENKLSYSRVSFVSNGKRMDFSKAFENGKYFKEAPLLITSNLRVFKQKQTSHGSLKLAKRDMFYNVGVFSNRSVNTESGWGQCSFLRGGKKVSVSDIVEKIKREVSTFLPRINLSRVKMIASDLNRADFETLISTLRKNHIEIGEQVEAAQSTGLNASGSDTDEEEEREEEEARDEEDASQMRPCAKRPRFEIEDDSDDDAQPRASTKPEYAQDPDLTMRTPDSYGLFDSD